MDIYELVRAYTDRRIRRWLMRRTGRRGVGFRQIPDEYLYETLGLYSIPRRRADRHKAGSWHKERRAVARIEATRLGLDVRFVVTNLDRGSAEWLYQPVDEVGRRSIP